MKAIPHCTAVLACFAAAALSVGAQEPRLTNLSVRTPIDGMTPAIVGFTVGPAESATVVLRAVGPSLIPFGVENTLEDPRLEVFNAAGSRIAANDDYSAADAAAFAAVGAFPLRAGGKDAGLVATLPAGSYTAHVAGPVGARGEVLVEAYLAGSGSARLLNLSVRAPIRADGGLIAGVTVAPGTGRRRLLMRAIGPTLGNFGVPNSAEDPRLDLFSNATRIAENDNWPTPAGADAAGPMALASAFLASGAFPIARNRDAALLQDLAPGSYTLAARTTLGSGNGPVLLEIYEAPADAPAPPSLAVQEFSLREGLLPNFVLAPIAKLRVVEMRGETGLVLRSLRLRLEWGGEGYSMRPQALTGTVLPGTVVELLPLGSAAEIALYYELLFEPQVETVRAEIVYTDANGREGVLPTAARIVRR
jgi:hypothetical protein